MAFLAKYFAKEYVAKQIATLSKALESVSTNLSIVALLVLFFRTPLALTWRSVPGLIIVGLLDTTANVLFAYASTSGLVSLASVLASLFPVVTVILAWAVLHERLARPQAIGVVCALAGVVMIASP